MAFSNSGFWNGLSLKREISGLVISMSSSQYMVVVVEPGRTSRRIPKGTALNLFCDIVSTCAGGNPDVRDYSNLHPVGKFVGRLTGIVGGIVALPIGIARALTDDH
jgi:hypothetical protein